MLLARCRVVVQKDGRILSRLSEVDCKNAGPSAPCQWKPRRVPELLLTVFRRRADLLLASGPLLIVVADFEALTEALYVEARRAVPVADVPFASGTAVVPGEPLEDLCWRCEALAFKLGSYRLTVESGCKPIRAWHPLSKPRLLKDQKQGPEIAHGVVPHLPKPRGASAYGRGTTRNALPTEGAVSLSSPPLVK